MTRKRNQHVVPTKDGWAVKGAGSPKATKLFGTQREAIDRGREIARNQRSELLIHGRDRRIREKNTYGRHAAARVTLVYAVGGSPWDCFRRFSYPVVASGFTPETMDRHTSMHGRRTRGRSACSSCRSPRNTR